MGSTKKQSRDKNNPGLNVGDEISGYRILRIEEVPEIASILYQLEHEKTGVRHIHISNKDKENTFGVTFRTVPENSTGVAHVLEHTVLCGSRKFNVRDPFFSMLKRGLSTFMNALTASDWTMYPFSTQNRKDYYNLMDIYLDAAFFPRLDELSFKQEGHRLETISLDKKNKRRELIYKGVVYNEMKGAMSSPGQIMGRALLKALYPDTTYHFNSGGEPSEIPSLTHEDLKQFHARFYHPSNAFFYTYGCFELKDHLEFIEKNVLRCFQKIAPDSRVPSQPRWDRPGKFTAAYPLSREEDKTKKYQAAVAWLTCDIQDSFEVLVLSILEQVLLGNAASPLRKALIDSGLGSALSDNTGFDADNRDTMFSCGLKDITQASIDSVKEIIFTTLKNLSENGIHEKLIESAIHQIEFHRKEITNTPHPFGIKLLLSFAGTWIHEGDPVACLNFDDDLNRLKQEIEKGNFLENRIKSWFLENPHRVLFTLAPDQDMEEKNEKKTRAHLAELLKKMKQADIDKIESDALKLTRLQESKEDLSVLPCLEISDVPPEITIIKPDTLREVTCATCYDKATSGILYFSCPAGLGHISRDLLYLIPFFCQAFTGAGTAKRDYAEMAELLDLYTGGVGIVPSTGARFADGVNETDETLMPFLALQAKALNRNIEPLFNIVGEFIADYQFTDHARLKNMLLQYRAGMESALVGNGHRFAILLSSRNFTKTGCLSEIWHGISQYQFIKKLTDQLDGSKNEKKVLETLTENLETIARLVFHKNNLRPVIAGENKALPEADKKIITILNELPDHKEDALKIPEIQMEDRFPHEGWSTSTSVSFVAQSFKTVRLGHADAPALAVISKILRSLYLHREIREKGGAYGGFAIYNSEEGIFSFGSYRDPNINRTLDVYKKSCDFILNGDYSDDDVKEAILQDCSEIDKPETPGPASLKAFYRDIAGLSDEKRQHFKTSLLKTDKNKIMETAKTYFTTPDSHKGTAVISGRDMLNHANKTLLPGQPPLELFVI
ncbi:MAG: insulinase family protein [Thermodesulfobacteriota bacterium]|nr:insulinase family protein [Thermodesulfobacteriota bacterium]